MRVVAFEAGHLDMIQEVWSDTGALSSLLGQPEYRRALEACGNAYSGFTDSWEYLGSCGFYVPWPGSGEVWAILDAAVQAHRFAFHRFVKSRLAQECERLNLHRLQTIVEAGNARAEKWARSIGFSEEPCLLRRFGPHQEDYFLYARLF